MYNAEPTNQDTLPINGERTEQLDGFLTGQ